jgi:hypothetical protein
MDNGCRLLFSVVAMQLGEPPELMKKSDELNDNRRGGVVADLVSVLLLLLALDVGVALGILVHAANGARDRALPLVAIGFLAVWVVASLIRTYKRRVTAAWLVLGSVVIVLSALTLGLYGP